MCQELKLVLEKMVVLVSDTFSELVTDVCILNIQSFETTVPSNLVRRLNSLFWRVIFLNRSGFFV